MYSDDEFDFIQNYAPPISRDGFLYHGNDFYVTGHGSRFHTRRADSAWLHSLLTYTAPPPVLTKKGKVAKRQPHPHEDESEEFYLAQLLHYGLPPATTKEAAKRALLGAFGSKKTLTVPAKVSKLEQSMDEEYRKANKVAKAKYLEEQKQEKIKEEERDRCCHWKLPAGSWGREADEERKDSARQANGELSGNFEVLAPFLTEQWPDATSETMWLKLCPSSTNSHLWGAFDFGVVTGTIRSKGALPTSVGDAVAFFWRGRETGEGESTFGERNIGTITFLGGGKFRAQIDWDLGNFDFAGTRMGGAKGKIGPTALQEWKASWRAINQRAYNRENIARWGRWGGDDDDAEQPTGSDTTEGVESDVEKEHAYDNCAFRGAQFSAHLAHLLFVRNK
ncbi:hypothetical protein DFH07DRAFT_961728 [Mycena maculata]|uniref:Uncharacterized protein n=1 Tax=Mycena maculata TaxID=230809 RepID=A0AAD7ISL7_9AGAR|nr:hypothetical protein DFH07DRAFT_961728 [Mycena maculata]